MEEPPRFPPSWSLQSSRGEDTTHINVGSKFYSRLDNKWFAKAEGQVTTWNRVSRASLHDGSRGQSRLPKGCVRRADQGEGRKHSPEAGGERTQYQKAHYLSWILTSFVITTCQHKTAHVYWITLKAINTTMSNEQMQFNRQAGLPKRLHAKCTGGRFSRFSNEFQKLNFTALFPGTLKEKWKSGFYYIRNNPSHNLLVARVQSQLSLKERKGCKRRRQEPHN